MNLKEIGKIPVGGRCMGSHSASRVGFQRPPSNKLVWDYHIDPNNKCYPHRRVGIRFDPVGLLRVGQEDVISAQ